MEFPSVRVGKTDYPLRSDPSLLGPLPHFDVGRSGEAFRLLDGPPYANGAPHLGHVLNKHLKDAVARAANATGNDVEWRPGWDCHGLPLELAVEKMGVDRSDRAVFLQKAREFASSQVAVQADVFRAQGWSTEWDRPWHTQDPAMEAGTLRVLAQLLDKGTLDVRFTAVPWCAHCGSTLSTAEQEERELSTMSWVVPFALDEGGCLLSWTTTPWTLPLHRALVLSPSAEYVALVKGEDLAWVSADTADHWCQVLGATRTDQLRLGADFSGAGYKTPWRRGKVAVDESVLPGAGTGVLHAVPGLSELDTQLGQVHGWELVQHLAPDGRVLESHCASQNGARAGTEEAQKDAHDAYKDSQWFSEVPYLVQHPHCWRHHAPLLTRASRQVFLHLSEEVRARALDMVSRMAFTPESARSRLLAAMKDRPDWCLSRQRTWGVPLALFLDKATGKPHALASTWMRRVADQVETQGVEAWSALPSETWLCGDVDVDSVERVDDVLDVWFDSGCVPQLVGAADVVVEGVDQHRGWFQSCLWVAAALDTPPPFKRVATHGFVLADRGEKLSKSSGGDAKGKSKAPHWATLPSDVVRVWALTGTEGMDKMWSVDTVQNAVSGVARLRNVLRFLLANALPRSHACDVDALPAWDRYWWKRSSDMADRVVSLCRDARTGEALALLLPFAEMFSSVVLGSWKDRLYCAPEETKERQDLDVVLKGCLMAWGKMLGVLTPRLRAEASPLWPHSLPGAVPSVNAKEVSEVEWMLGLRHALGPVSEALGRSKVSPGARRVVVSALPFSWPGQLAADALDVGQVVLAPALTHEGRVDYQGTSVYLLPSQDPVCPRCRRAQPDVSGCCATCKARCG